MSPEPRGLFPWSRPRETEEYLRDPELGFRVGQLVGACIMAARVLSMSEDDRAKAIGEKLAETAGWFYTNDPRPAATKRDAVAAPKPKP
jgi:hypothetical protein